MNDNNPIFPNELIKLELSETAAVGTILRLDSATDADTAPFAVKRYEIDDPSFPSYFELTQQNTDGSIIPQLKLIRDLDYESRAVHR